MQERPESGGIGDVIESNGGVKKKLGNPPRESGKNT